jgi:sensor histidine kinase regulating citrate/malate metabolism
LTCPAFGPTSCYATAGIALRVSGALKLHHHDKVGIASVGNDHNKIVIIIQTRVIFEVVIMIMMMIILTINVSFPQ